MTIASAISPGGKLTYDVRLDFNSHDASRLSYFCLDASEMNPELVDFSAFAFAKNAALHHWSQLPFADFGAGPFDSSVEFHTFDSPLQAGKYLLGTLTFDTEILQLAPAQLSISLADSVIGGDAG